MTDEKPEFNVKGIPKELTIDNGPSFLRADYKSKDEQNTAQKHQLERAKNSSYVGSNKTQ
ncbi:hypothetical protein BBP29_08435 [Alteromonas macleodii]|nr:hypothetical protein [Alteromonas macleodii]OZB91989.1 hypothetical protein BBP29_08435 [Alteromonas macleodii]|tara:strand:- start:6588 stop:6767 length:180 start_codon:yes stop_codon:yes gene_type:complete